MFTISIWSAYPANATEALVLAFLVGWLSRTWRSSSRLSWPSAALTTPTLLFFGVVLASCIVQVAVLQVWKDYPWSFVQDFFSTFLAREYLSSNPDLRPWAAGRGGFGFVAPAALLLEGLALFLIVIVLSRQDRGFPVRLTRMIVAGALGAAVLNMVEPGTAVITPADPVAALQDALGARTTTFVAKVDTAGSYFVMIISIAFGAAAVRSRWSFGWLAAGLTITAALWLTGTRAAIIAGLAVAVATVSWVTLRRYFSANRWQIGIMLAIITALLLLTYEAFQFRAESIRLATSIRLWLAETTLGMLASRPLLGFGIGQYRPWSGQFSPPELLAIYPRARTLTTISSRLPANSAPSGSCFSSGCSGRPFLRHGGRSGWPELTRDWPARLPEYAPFFLVA